MPAMGTCSLNAYGHGLYLSRDDTPCKYIKCGCVVKCVSAECIHVCVRGMGVLHIFICLVLYKSGEGLSSSF